MTAIPSATVSIGIVTYNSEDYIAVCLRSVFDQTWPSLEVKVLDNCSSDGTVDRIRECYPDVPIIVSLRNRGFAAGHNRLIAETHGSYYMPLNPDVLLTPTYVEEMVKMVEKDPDIGWVSGKLLFLTRNGEPTNCIYTTGHEICRNGIIDNVGYGEEDNGQYDAPREAFGANGAAPLYRRVMLEDVQVAPHQYFDEMFFMYGADPELDWRARILGWHCWYTPNAIGYHVAAASDGLMCPQIRLEYSRRRYIMVLKCAELDDVLSYYVPMLLGDLALALRKRHKGIVKAILGVIPRLPEIIAKRHRMMVRRRTAPNQIRAWFRPSPMHVLQWMSPTVDRVPTRAPGYCSYPGLEGEVKRGSLHLKPLRWISSMANGGGEYKGHRMAGSSPSCTLLASCFAVLAQELFDDLVTLSHSQQREWAQSIAQHQSAESGLFLDPLLKPNEVPKDGHNWQYVTWQFTFFALAALDALGGQPLYPLTFLKSFLESNDIAYWLVARDWANPWLEGNNIMFLASFLIQEWERTGNSQYEVAAHTIFDWLDEHQNPETGYWDLNQGASLLNAMAGAFHLYFLYLYLGRPVNFPKRIIDSTLSLQYPDGLFDPRGGGGACLDLDAVDILVKFSLLTDYRAEEVKAALTRAFEAILRNQNPDGGFCEAKRPPLWHKSCKRRVAELVGLDRLLHRPWQGRPVEYMSYSSWGKIRYRVDESDLWSTWVRPLALALISSRYPGEFIDDINWRFRRTPTLGWHDVERIQNLRDRYYT